MAATDDDLAGAAISVRVSSFYENNPYPPPVGDLKSYARDWDDARRRVDSHLFWPVAPFRQDRKILVAGCGTSQAAKYALRWPESCVVGIDFSATSIAETNRLKRKHRLHNLEAFQLPVERVAELNQAFDQVICTGVLHHLANPELGLRALRDVLEPTGAMHLMVYAPYGRRGIYLIQDYCRRLGIGTSEAEIRTLAAALAKLPVDHPLVPLLRNSPDFRDGPALADALLNPQDRAYSVPELFEFLASADLEFGRWILHAPYSPQCGSLLLSPHQPNLVRLPEVEQFAALELFRGTMIRHNFVAYRKDYSERPVIDFGRNDWLDWVPVRRLETVVVSDRLPAGAAAVLINSAHSFTDIYLPIDPRQKALFDAIDGEKSIGEIAPDDSSRSVARILFERLWLYDQIVFGPGKTTGQSSE
jgi:SAM-dependent methyltransferase